MEAHWVLVSLLCCLCGLSLSQRCEHNLLENKDFPGTDITRVYSPDVEHCQMMCTQHPRCLFFTFVQPEWTRDDRHFYCYLKYTATGEPNTQKPLLGVTSGYSLKPCNLNPDHDFCLPTVYEDIDFYGADYRFLFTADYEQCQRTCTQEPGCEFFTFVSGLYRNEPEIRYKCHLKFSWTVPKLQMVNAKAGVFSGFSHKFHQANQNMPCQTKTFPNTEIPGHDLDMLLAASPEHCLSLCSNHPHCTYFTYFTGTDKRFHCYLKNYPNPNVQMWTKANEAAVSGIPTRACQPDNSWVKAMYEGVDFQGSDMRYVLLDDPESCQRTCTGDHNCQFYTYVNETFFDSSYWRRCYLKRVITMPAPPKVTKLENASSGFSKKNCPTST